MRAGAVRPCPAPQAERAALPAVLLKKNSPPISSISPLTMGGPDVPLERAHVLALAAPEKLADVSLLLLAEADARVNDATQLPSTPSARTVIVPPSGV